MPKIDLTLDCASHLRAGFSPELRRKVIDEAERCLQRKSFDVVAFTGVSGALFGPSIADIC
jgi:hypothetical protein